MVRVPLAHKADVNAGNRAGYTPLAFIKKLKFKGKQFNEIVEILRQAGGGMVPDTGSKEVAVASAMPQQPAMEQQPAVAQPQSSGETEISEAARERDLDKLKGLLKDHPSLISSKEPETGHTPLHTVVIGGATKELLEFLLASGADVNGQGQPGPDAAVLCGVRRRRI